MLQSLLLPQGQFHPPSLFAGAKAYPRAVRNGPLRRESAAETAIRGPGPRNAFLRKPRIYAKELLGRIAATPRLRRGYSERISAPCFTSANFRSRRCAKTGQKTTRGEKRHTDLVGGPGRRAAGVAAPPRAARASRCSVRASGQLLRVRGVVSSSRQSAPGRHSGRTTICASPILTCTRR